MTQLIIIVIAAGILAQMFSVMLRLPSIIFLLLFGVALGPDGLGAIDPKLLGQGVEVIVTLSVAVILFEGGMTLKLRHLREVHRSVRRLVTVGALCTLAGAALAAHHIAGLDPILSLLFGALVSVTGPTVIRPLMRRIHVRREVATILEGEGILIDPVGAVLAVVFLEVALGTSTHWVEALEFLGTRLGAGAAIGVACGGFFSLIVRYYRGGREGELKNLIVLACALGCYGAAESFYKESGLMAVVAAGMVTQLGLKPHERELRQFKEQLTTLLISVLFVLLAANLRIDAMRREGWEGLATVLIVMVLIRPLNVWLCTRRAPVTPREKLFLSWTAPRGIVAASVASLAAFKLGAAGIQEGSRVEALVFLTVFLTVIVQGSTAGFVARILGILAKETGRVIIVGANPLARAIGLRYKETGRDVVLVDTNTENCARAQAAGLEAVNGSALDRETLSQARPQEADTFLACTENVQVNEWTAQVARSEVEARQVYVALDAPDRQRLDPLLERQHVRLAFGKPVPLASWAYDLETGEARIESVVLTKETAFNRPVGATTLPDTLVPVAILKEGHLSLCTPDSKPSAGDTLLFLVRDTASESLEAALVELKRDPHA
ncbi:MAG: cation:proton antiporter [Planctomycetes bacterium]|nr:cation:proton antiporter [Planctomycetota bacterium]